MSTGCPIDERVSQAEKIADEDGGHESGGNDKILPFGRFERAIEMPAMWYLLSQTRTTYEEVTYNGKRRNQLLISNS